MGDGRYLTPAEGYPLIDAVKDLRADLRNAVDRDVEEHQKLGASIDGVREQVGNLRLESASNSAALARIEVSLRRRNSDGNPPMSGSGGVSTALDNERKLSSTLVGIISGIVALGTAIVTYLATHK